MPSARKTSSKSRVNLLSRSTGAPPTRDANAKASPASQRSSRSVPRKHPRQRRQQRPISLHQLGTTDLPLQHPQLMPKQQDLDLLLPLRRTPQNDQPAVQ
jgi:hypothetical protein